MGGIVAHTEKPPTGWQAPCVSIMGAVHSGQYKGTIQDINTMQYNGYIYQRQCIGQSGCTSNIVSWGRDNNRNGAYQQLVDQRCVERIHTSLGIKDRRHESD